MSRVPRSEHFFSFVWMLYELGIEALASRDRELVELLRIIAGQTFRLLLYNEIDRDTPIRAIREYVDADSVDLWGSGDSWALRKTHLEESKVNYTGKLSEEANVYYATLKSFAGEMAANDRYLHLFRALYQLSIDVMASYDIAQVQQLNKIALAVRKLLKWRGLNLVLPIDETVEYTRPSKLPVKSTKAGWNKQLVNLEGLRLKYSEILG